MLRYLSLLLLVLYSCISFDTVENNPDTLNLFLYYRTKPAFQYSVTDAVQTLDTIPPLQLIEGTIWHYHMLSDTTSNATAKISKVRLDSLRDSLAHFTADDLQVTAILNGSQYETLLIDGREIQRSGTERLFQIPLPIPHRTELLPPYKTPCFQMEDGSYAYPLQSGIYSSTYGVIKPYSCLTAINGGSYAAIAQTLNEYYAREAVWFE